MKKFFAYASGAFLAVLTLSAYLHVQTAEAHTNRRETTNELDLTAFPNKVWVNTLYAAYDAEAYNTTTTARTVLAYETGMTFVVESSSDDPVEFDLPAAAEGLVFTFIDNDATAAADLVIDPATGDKINNQTAGVTYNATGDAYGETVTIYAIDDEEWIITSKVGTWSQGS